MASLSITWLGHSTFIITTPGGKRIVTDPWLEGNPACPADRKRIDAADLILLSHGHSDHSGDVVSVARATGAPVVTINEAKHWLEGKGVKNVQGLNFGGSTNIAGLQVALVPAVHTSSHAHSQGSSHCPLRPNVRTAPTTSMSTGRRRGGISVDPL